MLTVLIQVFGPVALPVCGQTSKFKFSSLQYVFLAFITISLLSRVTDVDVFSEIVQLVLLFSKTHFYMFTRNHYSWCFIACIGQKICTLKQSYKRTFSNSLFWLSTKDIELIFFFHKYVPLNGPKFSGVLKKKISFHFTVFGSKSKK